MNYELKGSPIPQTPEQKMANSRAAVAELEAVAAPLVEWIREKHDPYTEISIMWDRVQVKHEGIGIPFPYSEK